MSDKAPVNWESVARAGTHPLRLRVLDHLAEVGADSPNQMRQKFGVPVEDPAAVEKALAYFPDAISKETAQEGRELLEGVEEPEAGEGSE